MNEHPDWGLLIAAARRQSQPIVQALTYRQTWGTACRPVRVTCNDRRDYVIKGANTGRSAYNDQVVGRIASALGAPVAEVGLVDVGPDLISMHLKGMGHISPGLAHGSRYIPGCHDRDDFRYATSPENRPRCTLLALLFGWVVGREQFFCYQNDPPHLVYSFDHEQCFPNGSNWTRATLDGAGDVEADSRIARECGLWDVDLRNARPALERITPEVIAEAIGATPAQWGAVSDMEQVALASYLWRRRGELWSTLD